MKPALLGVVAGLVLAYAVGYNTIYARQRGQGHVIQQRTIQEHTDQRVQEDTAELLEQLERYHAQLPPEAEPSWLVREAVAASQQIGIDLSSIQQGNIQPGKQFTRLELTLQFRATYHQLGAFLDHLERSGRFIRVDHLAVTPSLKDGMGKPAVQLVLSTVYVPPVLDATAGLPARTSP